MDDKWLSSITTPIQFLNDNKWVILTFLITGICILCFVAIVGFIIIVTGAYLLYRIARFLNVQYIDNANTYINEYNRQTRLCLEKYGDYPISGVYLVQPPRS
jgi:hypothetical protein